MDPYGLPVLALAEAAGVSVDTARRWKREGRIPRSAARWVELFLAGELGRLAHPWRGFILRGDQLWTPYGFFLRPGEIAAFPYRFAQIRALEIERATPFQRSLF